MENQVKFIVKSIAPYGKGWQVNAFVNGEESEFTYYGATKKVATEQAKKVVAREGRLPNKPYKGGN